MEFPDIDKTKLPPVIEKTRIPRKIFPTIDSSGESAGGFCGVDFSTPPSANRDFPTEKNSLRATRRKDADDPLSPIQPGKSESKWCDFNDFLDFFVKIA